MTDDGVRCSRHEDSMWPVRCVDCDRERRERRVSSAELVRDLFDPSPAGREVSRTINAMLTAWATGSGKPSAVLAESLPATTADAWAFVGRVADGLAGMLVGELSRGGRDPLDMVRIMARFTEGLEPE